MDYLLTGIVIALIFLAAWIFYKRWASRRRLDVEIPEEYEEAEDPAPVAKPAPPPPPKVETVPEPIVEEK